MANLVAFTFIFRKCKIYRICLTYFWKCLEVDIRLGWEFSLSVVRNVENFHFQLLIIKYVNSLVPPVMITFLEMSLRCTQTLLEIFIFGCKNLSQHFYHSICRIVHYKVSCDIDPTLNCFHKFIKFVISQLCCESWRCESLTSVFEIFQNVHHALLLDKYEVLL